MIPGPLVVPLEPRRIVAPVWTLLRRLAALLLLLLGLIGTVAWLSSLSPLRLERWRAFETARNVNLDEAGTYVVFEEDGDAASREGPSAVVVSVRSIAGKSLPVRNLVADRSVPAQTYDIGFRRGRAIASFDIDRPGRFVVVSFPTAMLSPGESGPGRREPVDLASLPSLAIGRSGQPSSLGSLAGLVLVGGLPALAGLAVLAAGGRRRTAADGLGGAPPNGIGGAAAVGEPAGDRRPGE